TVNYIAKYIDDNSIISVNSGKKLGGAGGFQYGIKMVAQKDYDFVWLMDDDCKPTKNALNEFLKADIKLNHVYGFLSSKPLWTDNTLCTMNIQRRTLTKNVSDFSSE
ncbi:glycosyltransferase, partial [Lactobacillus crispatus]|uniref:glycosyltransferase n=1 Tax=Lactobacillus crispatus TaxID=47770 RepID=UPI000AC511C2